MRTNDAAFAQDMWNDLDALKEVRAEFGDTFQTAPFWITEVGVATGSSQSTQQVKPERQGQVLAKLYDSGFGHSIESFIIHRFRDSGSGIYERMGVVYSDSARKPAYCTLGAEIGTSPADC